MSTPIASGSPASATRSLKPPEWQRKAIGSLTSKLTLAAIVGVLAVALLDRFVSDSYRVGSHLLWLPWMVTLLLGIPIAYRQGVRDGRSHEETDR